MTTLELIKLAGAFGRFSAASQDMLDAFRAGDEAAMLRHGQTVQDIKNQFKGQQPPGRMPNPNWQVTNQLPQKFVSGAGKVETMPGYTQIDDVTGGRNLWSKGPKLLAREGFRLPDFAKMPEGRFGLGQASHNLWQNSYLGRGSLSPLAHGYPQLEAALGLAQTMGPKPDFVSRLSGGAEPLPALKAWRRMATRSNPELNQAFRRFSNPGALKFLVNAAKAIR